MQSQTYNRTYSILCKIEQNITSQILHIVEVIKRAFIKMLKMLKTYKTH